MAIAVEGPDGTQWRVRRSVLRGRDGHGRRLRWRGPPLGWWEAIQLGELAEIPLIGWIFLVVTLAIVAVLAVVFLPFVVLGLLELIIVTMLTVAAALAATLFGRPIIVRAECSEGRSVAWGVKGWRASHRARDQLADSIRAGVDPASALISIPDAVFIAER